MSYETIAKEGRKDYQKLMNVILIAFGAILGVVILYTLVKSVIGTQDLPYWVQAIIISIVALVAYSIKDFVRDMIKKHLTR